MIRDFTWHVIITFATVTSIACSRSPLPPQQKISKADREKTYESRVKVSRKCIKFCLAS